VHTFPDQFEQALGLIELNPKKRARAIAAHIEVRAHLETDEELLRRGVDTILIGSYKRHTSIRPGNDVDVFVKLPKADDEPETVYQLVKDALVRRYQERLTENRRSVKIDFGDDGFSVDAIGAVVLDDHWGIPEKADPEAETRTEWEDTYPERLTHLVEARNQEPKVGERGAFVPTVKLVRQTRAAHLGDAKPGGLYFEILTYWAFDAGVTGGSFAEIFAAALAWIAQRLGTVAIDPLLDPALMAPYAPAPSLAEVANAQAVFTELAGKAAMALKTEDECLAAAQWRQILGENDQGAVFPLPAGCTEEGRRIAAVDPNAARGPRGERGFA
jgi:Second Messenger Oligonucleotide or Dinucleotide Synthetase domain